MTVSQTVRLNMCLRTVVIQDFVPGLVLRTHRRK